MPKFNNLGSLSRCETISESTNAEMSFLLILNFGGATKKKSKQTDFSSESNFVEFDLLNVMNVIILGCGSAEVVG